MKRYKAALTRHGRHWCEIVIEGRDPDEALVDLIGRYPSEDGFALSVWEETEAARLIQVTGQTTRVLSVTFEKTPVDLAATRPV